MRRTVKKMLTTVALVAILIANVTVIPLHAVTVKELIGDTSADDLQDPIKLINLAMLKGVDLTEIKHNNKTIVDVLSEDELDEYAFSDTTILVYKEALTNAKTGIKNGWTVENIVRYADEAYRLYDDKIADIATDDTSVENIKTAIGNYIRNFNESYIDIGDLEGLLPEIVSNFVLKSIVVTENPEKIVISTDLGALDMGSVPYECIKTTWYTNAVPIRAILNGTVTEIEPTYLSTSIGGDNHKLVITYKNEDGIILLDENIEVGAYVKQGVQILDGTNATYEITIKYNDKNIDLLSLLGPTGKILVNEYKRLQAEEYDANRDAYIEKYLKTHISR